MIEEHSLPVILIIDTNQADRRLLKKILKKEFTCLEANSPQEALEILGAQPVDLIISAHVLPEMTGIALCQTLKTKKKSIHIPLILMIEEETIAILHEALKAGVANLLQKPLQIFNVQSAVHVVYKYQFHLHRLQRKIHKLTKLAERDPLTNFYNRYVLYEQGKKEVSKAQRGNLPLSILMIDIDGFKNINDALGHLVGDSVLMEFSNLLASTLRSIDITARFGGEEFVILLPKTDSAQALVVAEKIRHTVENYPFHTGEGLSNITVSIGVATLSKTSTKLEHLLENIDNALYQAKQKGRNQVVLFQLSKRAD